MNVMVVPDATVSVEGEKFSPVLAPCGRNTVSEEAEPVEVDAAAVVLVGRGIEPLTRTDPRAIGITMAMMISTTITAFAVPPNF